MKRRGQNGFMLLGNCYSLWSFWCVGKGGVKAASIEVADLPGPEGHGSVKSSMIESHIRSLTSENGRRAFLKVEICKGRMSSLPQRGCRFWRRWRIILRHHEAETISQPYLVEAQAL